MSYGQFKRGDAVSYLGRTWEVTRVVGPAAYLVIRHDDSRLDEYEQALVMDLMLVAEQPELGLE